MGDLDFKIDGLKELIQDLQKLNEAVPGEATNSLKKLANRFVLEARKNAPATQQRVVAGKNWKKHLYEKLSMSDGYFASINIINASNLHHLLENGHARVNRSGQIVGPPVPGSHYTEKTRLAWENDGKLEEDLDRIIKRATKKYNL